MTLCCKISRGSFSAGHEETDPQSTILRWVSCLRVSKEQSLFCTVTDVLARLTSRCREDWLETNRHVPSYCIGEGRMLLLNQDGSPFGICLKLLHQNEGWCKIIHIKIG